MQNDKRSLRTALVGERGIITSAYLATTPTGLEPAYFSYLLRAYDLQKVFYSMGGGLRQGMKFSDVKRLPVLRPSKLEQRAVAAFLDRETGKIDALVEAQRRLIELLKEKRQAVISHAVTKGLDPSAPMKASGVEWLGEVPAHWEVKQLKYAARVLPGFAFSASQFSLDEQHCRLLRGVNVGVGSIRWDEAVYWKRAVGDLLEAFELRPGDVVVGMDRPWIADGLRIATIRQDDIPALLLQRVAALKPRPGQQGEFVRLLLSRPAFYHHCAPEMTGVSVPHISGSQIEAYVVALPPEAEQLAIVEQLGVKVRELEKLALEAEAATAILEERRSALISAAVTGKIDVRGLVPAEAEAA